MKRPDHGRTKAPLDRGGLGAGGRQELPAGSYRMCAIVNPDGMWRERADNPANNSY